MGVLGGVEVAAASADFRIDGLLARVGFLVRPVALPYPEPVLLETWSDFFGADLFVQMEDSVRCPSRASRAGLNLID